MAGTATRNRESIPDEVLDGLVARVRDEGGVAVSALRLGKLSARAHAELLSALARANLEHTGRAIRVPLRDQVRAAVVRAGEAGIATKLLAREVKGARNAAELALAIRELAADGQLVLVPEGRAQRAAAPGPHWLAERELAELADVAQRLTALVKSTRPVKGKPRPTLGRGALAPAAEALQALAGRSQAGSLRAALRTALALAPSQAGLVSVPQLVRTLEKDHSRAALLDTLDAMAREGALELRPDSGIAGLPDEDRARCPAGLDGTPLSCVRLLPGERS
jgi:hypothetical protein